MKAKPHNRKPTRDHSDVNVKASDKLCIRCHSNNLTLSEIHCIGSDDSNMVFMWHCEECLCDFDTHYKQTDEQEMTE